MSIMAYLLEHNRIYNILGIFVILGITALFSNNPRRISFKLVASGLLMHFLLAFIALKSTVGQDVIKWIADGFNALYQAADKGIEFVFGSLSNAEGAWGFIFAIKVLPVIIFFGAFMAILFYIGAIQKAVSWINIIVRPFLGTSGAETLCAIANSFLGQTEAPLLIRNYLKDMTKSEILTVMISGMGSISGAILAVFALMGVPAVHLLAASIMSIPASIIISKIMYPETEKPKTHGGACVTYENTSINIFDAISQGASDGLWLALNVGAMLIAFLALLGLFNSGLIFACVKLNALLHYFNFSYSVPVISLNDMLAWICMPFAWLLGFTGDTAYKAAELIGTKVAVNELVAYDKMLKMGLSTRTIAIITYALCGFSNFSCIGIQIGGIGALAPEKRQLISQLGIKAVFGGALSNLLSAMVASLLL